MDLWKALLENAPTLFVTVVALVLILGAVLTPLFKFLGVIVIGGEKSKVVDDPKLKIATVSGGVDDIKDKVDGITDKLEAVQGRLAAVERDVSHKATKDEMHRLELAFTRLEGRTIGIEAGVQASGQALYRIEEHMYAEAAKLREAAQTAALQGAKA